MEVQALRAWAQQAQPVFICGIERSGTSTLQLALARHPALFPVPDVYETFIFARPEALLRDPVPGMTEAYLGGAAHLARLRAHYATAGLGDADRILAYFHYAAHAVYPGRRPLEKTPSHVRHLDAICTLFPRARVAVCTREPLAVVASYRQRLHTEQAMGLGRDSWGWLDRSLEQLIAHLLAVDRCIRTAVARHGERLFLVPYDWLTADAPAALAALCAFAQLPFDAAVLAPAPRQAGRVDTLLARPIAPQASDPGRHLSTAEQQAVRAATAGLHPLWDSPGPLGELSSAPPASA